MYVDALLKLADKFCRLARQEKRLLNVVQEQCGRIPPGIGRFLGSGVQGEAWAMHDDMVIKFQVTNPEDAKEIVKDLKVISDKAPAVYPRVYTAGLICNITGADVDVGLDHGTVYYYVMDKLNPIAPDRAQTISQIITSKDRGREIDEELEQSPYYNEAINLYNKLQSSGTIHLDMNPGNIMESESGELKLIDLNSVMVPGN